MDVYIEEQIRALAQMCEALICHIHYHSEGEAQGHAGYPGVNCQVEVCQRYAKAHHKMHFSDRRDQLIQVKGEYDELLQQLEATKDEIRSYQATLDTWESGAAVRLLVSERDDLRNQLQLALEDAKRLRHSIARDTACDKGLGKLAESG